MGHLPRLELLLQILQSEIQRTNGCTDPGSVCYAVAYATDVLQLPPEQVEVTTSANLFKNAIGVGVPGSGMHGMGIAAALGAVIPHPEARLAILDHITPDSLAAARALLDAGRVKVEYTQAAGALYIQARVAAGGHSAEVTIAGDYDCVTRVCTDGRVIYQALQVEDAGNAARIQQFDLAEIYALLASCDPARLEFLLEAAGTNRQAAHTALGQDDITYRKVYNSIPPAAGAPLAWMAQAQRWTGAACEGRMGGLAMPVMALGGSGNQGITAFLGLLALAEQIQAPGEQTARALAFTAAVSLYVKSYMDRLNALCGSALAVGPGVAAGAVLLLGGSFEQAGGAVRSVIAALNGVLCEGAGLLCPYKVSAAAGLALQAAYLALQGVSAPAGHGVIAESLEETFAHLGRINRALAQADQTILSILEERAVRVQV
ncbi:MAG: serine dehydratase subunit alpha family protein [Chloroflexi bacterium]|nr:serine dehydratase subunit alpha family protein [Chloroflexota bacterium]